MSETIQKNLAFKLKGRLYTLTVLQLLSTDLALIEQHIVDIIAQAPRLLDKMPIVIDCSVVSGLDLDLQTLCQCMHRYGLMPVALQGADARLETFAQCQNLALLHASAAHDRAFEMDSTASVASAESSCAKLVNTPVRSGQQIVSKGGDLIVTAAVSHGAELLADGHIHVYGALRGRALAGIAGDHHARIFCQSLDAELVAIAGYYRLRDAFEPMDTPCQIYLQDERIVIEPV